MNAPKIRALSFLRPNLAMVLLFACFCLILNGERVQWLMYIWSLHRGCPVDLNIDVTIPICLLVVPPGILLFLLEHMLRIVDSHVPQPLIWPLIYVHCCLLSATATYAIIKSGQKFRLIVVLSVALIMQFLAPERWSDAHDRWCNPDLIFIQLGLICFVLTMYIFPAVFFLQPFIAYVPKRIKRSFANRSRQ